MESEAGQRRRRKRRPLVRARGPDRPAALSRAHQAGDSDAWLHCGWGRLIFSHTFASSEALVTLLRGEAPDERDIAIYVDDPHVLLALAPQELFLDPSHMLRLPLSVYRPRRERPRGFLLRRMQTRADALASNAIYARLNMVQVPLDFYRNNMLSRRLTYLVAEEEGSGRILGSVTGVDHVRAYNDSESGASLWCLAVDPQCPLPGVGEALLRELAEHYSARGRSHLDLSVMHDNAPALALYQRLGFKRIAAFTVKKKNPINEQLFIAPAPEARLNPYARIIINEARRRGIGVSVEDEEAGLFRLSLGGRTLACRESLSELCSAVAMSRCDDKSLTRRLLQSAGLSVPDQMEAAGDDANLAFLQRHGRIVVKPARGEQGRGISVDVRSGVDLERACGHARQVCERILLEQFCEGEDLRVLVIGGEVVAAALRHPASVLGNGLHTVRQLIEIQSRRRAAATGGESRIPLDAETLRCLEQQGFSYEDILADARRLNVRRTANLHTGGTIEDVTEQLHPALAQAAIEAARVLEVPVVGMDMLVADPAAAEYVIIEANERPGLANHEPRPTAERFIDLLFPQSRRPQREN